MSKFKPAKYYKNIFMIDFDKIKKCGIKVIACDLDNTLVPHDVALPTKEVKDLVAMIKSLELEFVILSNNKKERVKKFANELGVDYYFSSHKPLKKNFIKIFKQFDIKAYQLCLVGDQVLTDVWGANRLGVMSVLVEPLASKDILYTRINRLMEKRVFKKLERKSLFKIGEYYE